MNLLTPNCLGTNSYDVHLGKYLATYKNRVLDAKKHNEIESFEIPDEGFVLQSGMLYLGVTKNTPKLITLFLFWKENLVLDVWELTFMLPQEKAMLVFVIPGL